MPPGQKGFRTGGSMIAGDPLAGRFFSLESCGWPLIISKESFRYPAGLPPREKRKAAPSFRLETDPSMRPVAHGFCPGSSAPAEVVCRTFRRTDDLSIGIHDRQSALDFIRPILDALNPNFFHACLPDMRTPPISGADSFFSPSVNSADGFNIPSGGKLFDGGIGGFCGEDTLSGP